MFAVTMERIDDWFQWTGIHWQIPNSELLRRTREWNEALKEYCEDIGLEGSNRDEVMRKHTATPLAPCANETCQRIETKVKEFKMCSRCSTGLSKARLEKTQEEVLSKKKCEYDTKTAISLVSESDDEVVN